MASELRDRVLLVSRLLTALKGKGAAYAQASGIQSNVLKMHFMSARLTLEESTEMAEALAGMHWQSEQHRDEVLGALAAGPSSAPLASSGATSRRQMQDYGAVVNYYTEDQWAMMASAEAAPTQKMRVLLEHPHALGLRCASESTIQRLTTLYLIVSEGEAGAKTTQATQKLAMTRHMKKELKALGNAPPLAYLVSLPHSPQELAQQQPQLYNAVFKSPPVPMKIDMQTFAEVLPTVRCRGAKPGLSMDTNFPGHQLQQFMSQMQGMMQMQMMAMQGRGAQNRMPWVLQEGQPAMVGCPPALQLLPPRARLALRAEGETPVALEAVARQDQELVQQFPAEQEPSTTPWPSTPTKPWALIKTEPSTEAPASAAKDAKLPRHNVADAVALIKNKLDVRDEEKAVKAKAVKAKAKDVAAKAVEVKAVKVKPAVAKKANPHFTIERTRNLVQCRSGVKGKGQYYSITWTHIGEAEAVRKAEAWVREQRIVHGLDD